MATKDSSPSQSEESKNTQPPFFTCLYTNASSIKGNTRVKKLNDLTTRFKNNMPDLIGISETGFTYVQEVQADPAEKFLTAELDKYEVFVCNIGEGQGRKSVDARGPYSRSGTYGGVAICVKKTTLSSELVNFENIPNPSYVDQVWCKVTLKSGETGLVGCIYQLVQSNEVFRNNKVKANQEIWDSLKKARNYAARFCNFLLIMGDFNNPNLKEPKLTNVAKLFNNRNAQLSNFCQRNDLRQFVDFPTFPSHTMLGFEIKKIQRFNYEVTVLSKLTINDKYKTLLNDHCYAYKVPKVSDRRQRDSKTFQIGRSDLIDLIKNRVKASNGLGLNAGNVLEDEKNESWAIVGDFSDPDITWPKQLEFKGQSINVNRPEGNILDWLITDSGATIKELKQFDPLGKKTGHSVLTFECRINGVNAVEQLTGNLGISTLKKKKKKKNKKH